jgi:(R,R)-butanediol dehydrogenase / meso-butanediol dehydrogenase / diacetyl reductase
VRAAVFHGPKDVRVETIADPEGPADDEVLLEVIRAAICGTDASEWDHGPILCRPGVVLGHEFVGRVAAVGKDVDGFRLGDRVVSGAGISCGHCRWCVHGRTNLCAEYRTLGLQVDGGLAEYVKSPASICYLVPDECSDDAAAMTQPLAVGLHALARVAPDADASVAVIGVGGIGSFIIAGAVQHLEQGRLVAVDVDPDRLMTATALGAHETVNAAGQDLAQLLLDKSNGEGFDVVVEASGAPSSPAAAIAGTRRGGRVLLVGLQAAPRELDLTRTIVREIDIITTVAHVCDSDIPAAIDLLARSNIAEAVAGPRISLESLVDDGLRPLVERRAAGKIVVAL